jgi:hypothetical protein
MSNRQFPFVALALCLVGSPVCAEGISGKYVEARTCDVWTGPCFANAEMNLGGKQAVMGWKVDSGAVDNVRLDGLSIVAVVAATDTLGLEQTGHSRTLLIVDSRADSAQEQALARLARTQGQGLVGDVIAVERSRIDMEVGECKEGGCATLNAGKAHITTRCLNDRHDKVCGNESAFYPPLAKNVSAQPAVAVEHRFSGNGMGQTWKDSERRGAYVGTFEVK